MTKSSAANVPESAGAAAGDSTTGEFAVRADILSVPTDERFELIDVTDRVARIVSASGVREGTGA